MTSSQTENAGNAPSHRTRLAENASPVESFSKNVPSKSPNLQEALYGRRHSVNNSMFLHFVGYLQYCQIENRCGEEQMPTIFQINNTFKPKAI